MYPFVRYSQAAPVIQPILTQLVNGQISPAAALSEMVRLFNVVLGENRHD